MIENVGRLLRTPLVLFVVLRDEELEALIAAEPPETPEDVSPRGDRRPACCASASWCSRGCGAWAPMIVERRPTRLGPALVNALSRPQAAGPAVS